MSRDRKLGLGLSGISLSTAILTGVYLAFTGGTVPLAVFAWPALGFTLGIAIAFFSFVEVGLNIDDEIEQFPQLIEDDIHNLRSGTITFTHLFVVLTLFAAGIQFGLLMWYRKELASWGSINVLVIALLVVATTLLLSLRANWFQLRRRRLAPHFFVIPAIGWLLCIIIGVRYAEPIEYGGLSPLERSQVVRSERYWGSTRTGMGYGIIDTAEMAGDAVVSFDCDGEGCLVALLIAVVFMSAIASATIPHFWVVATMLLLTLMALISLRELLYSDDVG